MNIELDGDALLKTLERLESAEARAAEQDKTIIALCDERDELRRQLEQAQRDLKEYRIEIERMTRKAMTE